MGQPKQSDLEKARLARSYYQKQLFDIVPKPSKPAEAAPVVDFTQFPVSTVTDSYKPGKESKSSLLETLTGTATAAAPPSWQLSPEGSGTIASYLQKTGEEPTQAKVQLLANMIKATVPGNWASGAPERVQQSQVLQNIFQPPKEAAPQNVLDETGLARMQEAKKSAWDQAKIMVGEKMGMSADKKPGDPIYDKWLNDSTHLYKYMIQGFESENLTKYQGQPKAAQAVQAPKQDSSTPKELTYDPSTGEFI